MTKMAKKIFITALGLMTTGVGIGFLMRAGLGVDPPSVFQDGLANFFGVSFGVAAAVMNAVVIAVLFFIDRRYVNIASIMAIFLIGFTCDYVSEFLQFLLPGTIALPFQVILMLVGWALVALGIPVYIAAELGVGACDSFSEVVTDKITHSYRVTRVTFDVSYVVLGYLMGGQFGVATIIAAFGTGPLIGFYRPRVVKIIKPWIAKSDTTKEANVPQ